MGVNWGLVKGAWNLERPLKGVGKQPCSCRCWLGAIRKRRCRIKAQHTKPVLLAVLSLALALRIGGGGGGGGLAGSTGVGAAESAGVGFSSTDAGLYLPDSSKLYLGRDETPRSD